MNRTLKFLILLLLSGALLTGCNTARGFGEDIQGLGHAISHAVS
ncbi:MULTISPECIES: entericidin A/B family lipoprotein [Klebsiella]|nr:MULTISPECIES: entericidin A/B family lipoprotein [Klebsiella]EKZ9672111.1 entericidin A/B family lipoprotein [Klebsiella aerogenes]ELA2276468.1 entericidin A/B family lipoprotein [Klebsiella aerogenes]ELT7620307.1 entericidin A/B family lipoprotein [Klebsiella aerogenes]ELY3086554.1 entericidin A/B family lipoprotein [Klebsiella aerogenes]MDA3990232.1 entericidin A/B family lipoprotein [Klebsiella aerogenes]